MLQRVVKMKNSSKWNFKGGLGPPQRTNWCKTLNLLGAVKEPVTFVMSPLPGKMVSCKTIAEKWKLWTLFQVARAMSWRIFWNMKSFQSTQLKFTKGKQQVLKRQFWENESCDLFSSKSLDVSQVIGNTPLSGPMQRTVETDALRLHWECSSGCGLICGDSFGKQFQNFAVYWKWYCFWQ